MIKFKQTGILYKFYSKRKISLFSILNDSKNNQSNFNSNNTNGNVNSGEMGKNFLLQKPEPPITCCGSGCQNCVYLQYADDLMKYYHKKYSNSNEGLREALNEVNKLTDENLKSYLVMEMNMKFKR